ncbi:MAG: thiamine pyrophosphate-dependent enzyme [Pseudomonadota bacterium]
MTDITLLNPSRPPVFCPGCSHEKIVRVLDDVLVRMGLKGHEVCIVSDIGCSGFFDVFFHTHALHGLHGRALTYAAGIKLCRPDLTVIATMGDGGLGIGAAHVISACRRNLDLTLLALNNFNFGMTGGQCSSTTPNEAVVGSGFLNRLEKPLDICRVAVAAGAGFVCRCSAYRPDLADVIEQGVRFNGFSLVEIRGICPGRYAKLNRITPQTISADLAAGEALCGEIEAEQRPEYGTAYRREAAWVKAPPRPREIEALFEPPQRARRELVFLGAAGQHVITGAEVLTYAALIAGMHASQKNEYDVTVLRGPSISEVIVSPGPIDFNGCTSPDFVFALAPEGIKARHELLQSLNPEAMVIKADDVEIPPTAALVLEIDFSVLGIRRSDWGLASLGVLAGMGRVISEEMLDAALDEVFSGGDSHGARRVLAAVGRRLAE